MLSLPEKLLDLNLVKKGKNWHKGVALKGECFDVTNMKNNCN